MFNGTMFIGNLKKILESLRKTTRIKNLKIRKIRRKNMKTSNQLPDNDRKRSKHELISKAKKEVEAGYKAASFVPNVTERRQMQSETLSSLFETYFHILKHTMYSTTTKFVFI
ncbi:hypothetical protein HN51_064133 [Arachis hypogaea]